MINKLWLPALFLLTAIFYEQGVKNISDEYVKLEKLKEDISLQKDAAQARNINLERQLMSQSDPNWITLTLIRVLGVIPEGQVKVYFKPV